MFWDKIAGFYDFFEKCFNGEVNKKLVAEVAGLVEKDDEVYFYYRKFQQGK